MLHMHENGQMMQTRQYRNDSDGVKQLIHTANVEYFSFLQAGGHMTTYGGDVTIEVSTKFARSTSTELVTIWSSSILRLNYCFI